MTSVAQGAYCARLLYRTPSWCTEKTLLVTMDALVVGRLTAERARKRNKISRIGNVPMHNETLLALTASCQPGEIPAHFREVYSAQAIAGAVAGLATEITPWCARVWSESRKDVLVVPVLRGGLFFVGDLVRQVACSVEIAPMRAQAYEVSEAGIARARVEVFADSVPVRGRSVLVVDDVCDSGRTLEEIERAFIERGAREVRTVTLIRRLLPNPTFVPCWVGFQHDGDEWFVGYGMDAAERWRNLPAIYGFSPQAPDTRLESLQ